MRIIKKLVILITLSSFFTNGCTSNPKTKNEVIEEAGDPQVLLTNYLIAGQNGEIDTLKKYMYKGAIEHILKISNYENEEEILNDASKNIINADKVYSENGIEHIRKIDTIIGSDIVGGDIIKAYRIIEKLKKGTKEKNDTTRVIAIKSNNKWQFIFTETNDIEDILARRYTKSEISKILNLAYENNYQKYLDFKKHDEFKDKKWKLVAWSNSINGPFYQFNTRSKNKIFYGEVATLPEIIDSKKNTIKKINGKTQNKTFDIKNGMFNLDIDGFGNEFSYKLSNNGQQNGKPIDYFDLYILDKNDTIVLEYESQ